MNFLQWNLENKFTGWTDIELTQKGKNEAKTAGKLLKEASFEFDLVYTSVIKTIQQLDKNNLLTESAEDILNG